MDAIVDWIDRDQQPTLPYGAEDEYYLGLEPAYRSANQLFSSVTELRLIRGIGEATYERLSPFVSALPRRTTLNVNTAKPEILQSISADFDEQRVREIILGREEMGGFGNVDAFSAQSVLAGLKFDATILGVATGFFAVTASAAVGRGRVTSRGILSRDSSGSVHTLYRSEAIW